MCIEKKLNRMEGVTATRSGDEQNFARFGQYIAEAIADPGIRERVAAALAETQALLVAKHGFDDREHGRYVAKILERFANEHLPDTVERVGRAPLRKLSRQDRIIAPAAELLSSGS